MKKDIGCCWQIAAFCFLTFFCNHTSSMEFSALKKLFKGGVIIMSGYMIYKSLDHLFNTELDYLYTKHRYLSLLKERNAKTDSLLLGDEPEPTIREVIETHTKIVALQKLVHAKKQETIFSQLIDS